MLPELRQGQQLPVESVALKPGKTTPPPRYTEATLLSAMEHPAGQVADRGLSKILEETSGLGTPATRADIIEKLFSAFYVERRGKELVPTSKGIQLVELVPEELRSAEMTAKWEDQLAAIAKGKASDQAFVDGMRRYAAELVTQVKASDQTYRHDNQTRTPCPDCGKYLLRVKGKRGEMLGLSGPGLWLSQEPYADDKCTLSQLPQENGAARRRRKADVCLCVRLPGKTV